MPRLSKFDKLVIGKATISMIEQPTSLVAEAAFVDSTTGATHGRTTASSWSEATKLKLHELLDHMAKDLEAVHFTDRIESAATTSGSINVASQGLGEHLGAKDDGIGQG